MEKKLLITVDTEGDNLWNWKNGDPIATENALYISRFQNLCEKYGFIPTYLTNYEMVMDERFVNYFKEKSQNGKCEIGMHLHAWNSPPEFSLKKEYSGQPYITEYPEEIILEKHLYLKKLLSEKFGCEIETYRAGRWAMNEILVRVLEQIGIRYDCSVTPGISYQGNLGQTVLDGPNYKNALQRPHMIGKSLIEIPMTTFHKRSIEGVNIKNRISHLLKGRDIWLRTAVSTIEEMKSLLNQKVCLENRYAMFMIHSSELMPGGSPYFTTDEDIEKHYKHIEELFKFAIECDYIGSSVASFGRILQEKGEL